MTSTPEIPTPLPKWEVQEVPKGIRGGRKMNPSVFAGGALIDNEIVLRYEVSGVYKPLVEILEQIGGKWKRVEVVPIEQHKSYRIVPISSPSSVRETFLEFTEDYSDDGFRSDLKHQFEIGKTGQIIEKVRSLGLELPPSRLELLKRSPGWKIYEEAEGTVASGRKMKPSVLRKGVIINGALAIRLEGDDREDNFFRLKLFEEFNGEWRQTGELPMNRNKTYTIKSENVASFVRQTRVYSFASRAKDLQGKVYFRPNFAVGLSGQFVEKIEDLGITLPPETIPNTEERLQ